MRTPWAVTDWDVLTSASKAMGKTLLYLAHSNIHGISMSKIYLALSKIHGIRLEMKIHRYLCPQQMIRCICEILCPRKVFHETHLVSFKILLKNILQQCNVFIRQLCQYYKDNVINSLLMI